MLPSLLIVFREAMEAGLIVGIVLAATEGLIGRGVWLTAAIAAGLLGAGLVAVFAAGLSDLFDGAGQEVFTAGILGLAVVMLSWHIVWTSRHGRALAADLRRLGQDVTLGRRSLAALAIVVATAVLREGAEVVLFLYGAAAGSSPLAMLAGGMAGASSACALSFLLYRGLVAIPLKRLFSVTNSMIALMAAGMAGQCVSILHSADLLPGFGEQLWDTSAVLADDSLAGRSLHALVGYSARPSGIQLAAWVATLAILAVLSRLSGPTRTQAAPPALPSSNPAR